MAISRERLDELIKQGATIYCDNTLHVEKKVLTPNKYKCDCDYLWEVINSRYTVGYDLEDLYETQEEAEWHLKQAEWYLKYHATRTEELNLPTWEEFKNSKDKCIGFWSKTYDTYWLSLRYDKIRLSRSDDDYECEIVERTWETTEENYAKACDLCLKLFKGEEE